MGGYDIRSISIDGGTPIVEADFGGEVKQFIFNDSIGFHFMETPDINNYGGVLHLTVVRDDNVISFHYYSIQNLTTFAGEVIFDNTNKIVHRGNTEIPYSDLILGEVSASYLNGIDEVISVDLIAYV